MDCGFTNFLVGDIKGLEYLRSQIDLVIGGEQLVLFRDGFDTELEGIIRSSRGLSRPPPLPRSFKERVKDARLPALILAVCLVVLALLGLGVWKVIELVL